jgi:hypothetical protein
MTRTRDFYEKQIQQVMDKEVCGVSYAEHCLAAGLGNGDISAPEWLGMSEDIDHMKIWDREEPNESDQMGFIIIEYGHDQYGY